jgi:hypothetical protein
MEALLDWLTVKNILIHFIQQWLNMSDITQNFSKANSTFLKVAAISTGIVAVFGLYTFYKNNLWSPTVKVDSIDYNKGIAYLTINGKPFVLRGESSYLIAYDWGVRFGTSIQPNGKRYFDRIEVLKRNLVHKVLKSKDEVNSFTGNEETFWDDAFFGGKGSFGANVTAK